MDGGLVCIQGKGLRTELDDSVGGEEHECSVEQHVVHECCPDTHRPHREQQQEQSHLGAALHGHSCNARKQHS